MATPQRHTQAGPAAGLPGLPLGGSYRILGRLRPVEDDLERYLARDTRSGAIVWVDRLSPALAANPRLAGRFIGRALAVARLRHPALARVLDAGEDDGWCYRVREPIDGLTLPDSLRAHGPCPPDAARRLIVPLIEVLAEAHHAGITHYDIRPETLVLGRDGVLKVQAFGWSGLAASPPLACPPPEVRAGHPHDERSAVYLAGVVLHALLNGRAPGADAGIGGGHPPPDPPALAPVDRAAATSLVRAMEYALSACPEDRYESLAELHQALSSGSAPLHRLAPAAPAPASGGAWSAGHGRAWRRRMPAGAGIALPILAVLALLGAPLAVGYHPWAPAPIVRAVATPAPALAPATPTPAPASATRPAAPPAPPDTPPAAAPTASAARPDAAVAACTGAAPWTAIARGAGDRPGAFASPLGLAVDAAGNLYVADTQNHRIQKLSPRGAPLATWGRPGNAPGELRSPSGIAVDSGGAVYVADTGNDRVQRFAADGRPSGLLGGSGSGQARMLSPRAVALDALDNVYVADAGNHRIQKFSPTGEWLAAWGREGSGAGEFSQPRGLAVDRRGNVYVSDIGAHRIQVLSPAGAPLAALSLPDAATWAPMGLALDARGSVYAAVAAHHTLAGFGADWQPLAAWNASDSLFRALRQPVAITIDRQGSLYVMDAAGPCILRLIAPA